MLRSVFLSLVIFVVALSSMVAPSTSCTFEPIVFALSAPGCTCSYLSRYSDAAPSSHMASPTIVTPSPVDDVVSPPHKDLSLPVDDDDGVEDCCIPVEGCELGLLTSYYEDKVSLPTDCCKVLSTISDDSFYKGGFGTSPIFLSKERPATTTALSSNSIRWVIGPSGTVVIFPNEMGLPSIFEPKACSYPPPREKCASPSCMNTYKYRLQIQATFLQSPVLQGNT
ncbi:hypothetical protein P3S68_020723 [Capsicum galapagoense]